MGWAELESAGMEREDSRQHARCGRNMLGRRARSRRAGVKEPEGGLCAMALNS